METRTTSSPPPGLISSITRKILKRAPDYPYRFTILKIDFGRGSSTPICLKIRSTSLALKGRGLEPGPTNPVTPRRITHHIPGVNHPSQQFPPSHTPDRSFLVSFFSFRLYTRIPLPWAQRSGRSCPSHPHGSHPAFQIGFNLILTNRNMCE